MFFDSDIKGDRLPPKTLCLTYDDGPGPHTLELGRYLFEEGIRAAFFVIGRHAEGRGDVLGQLKEWGHLVGNHTYSHPALVDLALAGGDVAAEVWRAHRVIEPYLPEGPAFFRPPYGNWKERVRPGGDFRPTSVVAGRLNRDGRLGHYVGPIKWEISGEDYDYWRRGAPAEEGARRYLDEIDRAGRGIVLMHDSSDEEPLRVNNRTFEMTRLLVPVLKARGYRFVRLDSVPQVQSAMRVSSQIVLLTDDDQFLSRRPGSDAIVFGGPPEGVREVFGVIRLGGDRFALRAGNGCCLSAPPGGGEVLADGLSIGDGQTLEMDSVGGERVAIRTAGGHYLAREGDRLVAAGTPRAGAKPFLIRQWAPT